MGAGEVPAPSAAGAAEEETFAGAYGEQDVVHDGSLLEGREGRWKGAGGAEEGRRRTGARVRERIGARDGMCPSSQSLHLATDNGSEDPGGTGRDP
ncbi:hypothetical protein Shyhy02_23360 [Streptomyces hygroscopicus subsp. hygroscopicus]|nr:hypothetical protein Shyhy02_23360 [Streptomyces hygroscopicus subsp. hygroscopicus]